MPSATKSVRRAACNCGQLTAICEGDPIRVSVCHCLACKRRTGSAFSNNAVFASDRVTLTGETKHFTRIGEESGLPTLYSFCPDCGSVLCYQSQKEPDVIVVPVGAFADLDFPPPTRSFYHDTRRARWVSIETEPLAKID
jgi:hypothetical protein